MPIGFTGTGKSKRLELLLSPNFVCILDLYKYIFASLYKQKIMNLQTKENIKNKKNKYIQMQHEYI